MITRSQFAAFSEVIALFGCTPNLSSLYASVFEPLSRVFGQCPMMIDRLPERAAPIPQAGFMLQSFGRAVDVYPHLAHTHPAMAYALAGPALRLYRLTELCSPGQLRNNPFMQEIFAPSGITDQIAITVRIGKSTVTLTVNRDACFTADELSILSMLRSHMGQALRRLSPARAQAVLTPREELVLQLLAEGCRDSDIAARLYCAVRTVSKHVENILAKLGAENRSSAVNFARHAGLLPQPHATLSPR